jgi:ABC-type nitrate/sulfonate/bicarbonate transport system permease component
MAHDPRIGTELPSQSFGRPPASGASGRERSAAAVSIDGARRRLGVALRSPVVLGTIGILIALAIAEIVPVAGLVAKDLFPPIGDSLRALVTQVQLGSFWTAVGQTMEGWALGLALAFVFGVALGAVIGANQIIYKALQPSIDFLRSIPGIAALPLAELAFGNFYKEKVFLIAFGSVWYFVIQTTYGVRSVDTVARDTVRSFRFGRLSRTRHLVLPSALPYVATGLRLAAAVSLAIGVTVELLSGAPGLGRNLFLASQSVTELPVMYALVIFTGILGIVIQLFFQRIERHMLRWHPSYQGEQL